MKTRQKPNPADPLAIRLRRYWSMSGLTQTELHELLAARGCPATLDGIRAWLTGKRRPSRILRPMLERALKSLPFVAKPNKGETNENRNH
jgi:hypothetical protein